MVLWDRTSDLLDFGQWRELDRMHRRMNRLLRGIGITPTIPQFPPLNVWSDAEQAVVTAEMPGVRREDLDITVTNDVLSVRGSRAPEALKEGERCVLHERGHGSFARTVRLPFAVDSSKASARYIDGVLRITLPRSEAEKPRRVEIKG